MLQNTSAVRMVGGGGGDGRTTLLCVREAKSDLRFLVVRNTIRLGPSAIVEVK